MSGQLFWEDIKEGMEVTPLSKVANSVMLAKFAGASGDFNPIHYEDHFARTQGLDGIIIHGALKRQWLMQMLTDWIGGQGTLRKFSCQYRMMDHPRRMISFTESEEGETWLCKGRVTKTYVAEGQHYVDCDIWLENGKGEKTTQGCATVILPSQLNS